jgi:hypothetical protein
LLAIHKGFESGITLKSCIFCFTLSLSRYFVFGALCLEKDAPRSCLDEHGSSSLTPTLKSAEIFLQANPIIKEKDVSLYIFQSVYFEMPNKTSYFVNNTFCFSWRINQFRNLQPQMENTLPP